MKVLITGSEGFLGKWLQKKAGSNSVVPFDISLDDDIRSAWSIRQKLDGVDAVIHAAAVADLNESAANPELNFAVNVAGTDNVASEAAKKNIPVLFVSTCCVYGNEQPADVFSTVPVPTELYAWSKLAGEAIVRGYGRSNMVARIPTMYGPMMRPALFVYRVIDAIEHDRPVDIHGDGRQTRQLGYVEDVASLIWRQLGARKAIWNLNPKEATSCVDIVAMAASIMVKPVRLNFSGDREGQILRQNIAPMFEYCHRPFIEGLKQTIEWYRDGAKYS